MGRIEAYDLTRKFGELTAVAELSLEVGEGEVFGFLGPNRAGKTTTIRMLGGISLFNPGLTKMETVVEYVTPSRFADSDAVPASSCPTCPPPHLKSNLVSSL